MFELILGAGKLVADLLAHRQFSSLYPLKTFKNFGFSDVFREIKMKHWPKSGHYQQNYFILVA